MSNKLKRDTKKIVTVNIVNWDKYQHALKGKGGPKSRRSWVAVSVDLFSDMRFISLPLPERMAWIGVLLHAGKVGNPFKASEDSLRLEFKLRSSPKLALLEEQGLIEIEAHTRQDRTRQTGQNIPVGAASAAEEPPESNTVAERPPPNPPPQSGKPTNATDEMIWRTGIAMLVGSGMEDREARGRLGRLVKNHSAKVGGQQAKERLAAAIATALVNRPVDPMGYITATMADRPENKSNFEQNVAVMTDWLQEQSA